MATEPRYSHARPDLRVNRPNANQPAPDSRNLAATSGAIALFYLFCIGCLAWIGFVLGFYLMGCLAAIYVIGGLLPAMNALNGLAMLIFRSLRLKNGPDWYMRLQRSEAHELYAMMERVAGRIGVEPPQEIFVEMSARASVVLTGNRTGSGGAKLYVGYDLLAVLTESELESVIAHELAHCRLVIRAHQNWCVQGLRRALQMHENLAGLLAEYERKKVKFHTASVVQGCLTRLIRLMNHKYAEFCREEERAADRLAAECYGAESFRNGLIRIYTADYKRKGIDWRDRKIYTQRSESFSEWLHDKLTPADAEERKWIEERILQWDEANDYDHHPPLKERLASLPAGPLRETSDEPALKLLSNPDEVAKDYMRHMSHFASEEERKATAKAREQADKRVKRTVAATSGTPMQGLGAVIFALGIFSVLAALVMLITDPGLVAGAAVVAVTLLACGWLMIRKFARRECFSMPTPSYDTWRESLNSEMRDVPVDVWKDEVEPKVIGLLPESIRGKRAKSSFWAEVCYNMLSQCDYRGALIASDRCLAADATRFEGLMTRSIALAWLGDIKGSYAAFSKAYATYPVGQSMSWGLSWALMLCGNVSDAEMYLLKAVDFYPESATVIAALSMVQRKQGKLHEATDSACAAVAAAPQSVEVRKNLVSTLLEDGQAKDALTELETLNPMAPDDIDLMFMTTYASGLFGDTDRSIAMAARLAEQHQDGKTMIRLARVLGDSGSKAESLSYFEKALDYGFYPEALYAQARAEFEAKNKAKAMEMLTSALDCTKDLGKGSVSPLEMATSICTAMIDCREESQSNNGYEVRVDLCNSPVQAVSMSLLVCAESIDEAREHARWLYRAMCPGLELAEKAIVVEELAEDKQPKEPVPAGIHGVRVEYVPPNQ